MSDARKRVLKYQKIKQDIVQWIDEREQEETDKCLPTENELCEMFHGSRMTIRKAVDELVEEDVLYRIQGKGTFVRMKNIIRQPLQRLTSFSEDMKERGMSAESQVLLCEKIAANGEIAEKLNIQVGEDVILLRRLRLADKAPIAIENTYLIAAMCDDSIYDLSNASLYEYMREQLHICPKWAKQTIGIGKLSKWEAQLLGNPDLTFALLTHRQTFDENDNPIEYVVSKYNGERYQYHTELHL